MKLKLPINQDNKPDWDFIEYYVKSLPYSSNLKENKEQSVKKKKGLSDEELVSKYEAGGIDFGKAVEKTLKPND